MLVKLVVKNFKSIGSEPGVELELKPITLLFGLTGSGKSNILEAIWRLSRILTGTAYIHSLWAIEPKYENEDMIFHKASSKNPIIFKIISTIPTDSFKELQYLASEVGITIRENSYLSWEIAYGHEYAAQEVSINDQTVLRIGLAEGKYMVLKPEEYKEIYASNPHLLSPGAFMLSAPKEDEEKLKECEPRSKLSMRIVKLIQNELVHNYVSRVALLSPIRGRTPYYGDDSKSPREMGLAGENLIECLSILSSSRRYREEWDAVKRWASDLRIIDLYAGFRGSHKLGSDYQDDKLNVVLELAQASHGARQALSVICQLFWPHQGLILIEEPEISLHPEAVSQLPLMFYDAVKFGKQIIATTHSTILPMALSRAVKLAIKEGPYEDPNDLIAVYEIEKGSKGTFARKLMLNEYGYIKGYIPSFFEVERRLLREWEETIPSKV